MLMKFAVFCCNVGTHLDKFVKNGDEIVTCIV